MVDISTSTWSTFVLGYLEADGYQITVTPPFTAVAPASGAKRYRQDRAVNVMHATFSKIFDFQKMKFFELWYYKELRSGQDWFEMPIRTSIGVALYDCHFVADGYKAKFLGGRELPYKQYWQVSADIEYIYSTTQPNQPSPLIPIVMDTLDAVDSYQDQFTAIDFIIAPISTTGYDP